ncbi:MAG: tRNA pseudouridine(38-40) synthase TruA [Clostridia bacterium]|nr:tRNA pseudouridine(38-40) synthase TruA [Clostridia bacterium]
MNNYKMIIAYDGSRYKGWQRLGNGENSIQEKIETVLSRLLNTEIQIIGSGRTDAGVHARGQVANFHCKKRLDVDAFLNEVNRYLPEDIGVQSLEMVDEDFHARFSAKTKIYRYYIVNQAVHNPFVRKYALHIPEPLDIEAMQEAAAMVIGEHDFTTFTNAKSKKKSMVRRLDRLDIFFEGEYLIFEFEGNGFLHNMVRRLTGTLIQVGLEQIKPAAMGSYLKAQDRHKVTYIAEGKGLFLESVAYDD